MQAPSEGVHHQLQKSVTRNIVDPSGDLVFASCFITPHDPLPHSTLLPVCRCVCCHLAGIFFRSGAAGWNICSGLRLQGGSGSMRPSLPTEDGTHGLCNVSAEVNLCVHPEYIVALFPLCTRSIGVSTWI